MERKRGLITFTHQWGCSLEGLLWGKGPEAGERGRELGGKEEGKVKKEEPSDSPTFGVFHWRS